MSESLSCDICVIGGGSGGLSVAAGAARLGARTVLIEGGRMGGDCLNVGCVPSKSLIAAAQVAATARRAAAFGIDLMPPRVDWQRVHGHVRAVIDTIAPHDSVERFEGLGVRVIRDWAQFASPETVLAGGLRIGAKRFVIATGSVPAIPAIPGLSTLPFLTNETVFDIAEPMAHLLVLGAGAIGAELAQAYARLGVAVTVLEQDRLLPREDPALVEIVRRALVSDGVTLREGFRAGAVMHRGNDIVVKGAEASGQAAEVAGSHLLVATGRRANLERLDLAKAQIAHTARGITVDARLRTSNRRIFAMGDCVDLPGTGPLAFTHVAGEHAGIVIRNALFRLPARVDPKIVPRVTFTDPELAAIGLPMEAAATVVEEAFAANDRAQTGRATAGRIRIGTARNGRILGVAMAGPQAGELLAPWCLALRGGMKLAAMARLLLPYPTLGEISKRAAGRFYAPRVFGPASRRLVGALLRLP